MGQVLRIGLIGCGTVGQGVVRLIRSEGDAIEAKTGLRLELARVADTNLAAPSLVGVPEDRITADANDLFADPSLDVIVELVGGTTVAREFVLKALQSGKDVVTANKALLARCSREIYAAARASGRCIGFEASCGGGIPLILPLRSGLVANRIQAIYGILNGTCNYILTEMSGKGKSYAEALAEAQAAGYAELDPRTDVQGHDTAHKLAVLASMAFCCDVDLDRVHVEGIEHLDAQDLQAGRELGYVCKLLGIADQTDAGLSLRVHPSFVRADHPLAGTNGSFNAVSIYGNWVGHTLFYGRGAGSRPTASAVVADLVDVGVGNAARTFERFRTLNDRTPPPTYAPIEALRTRYYVRIMAVDQPGVMARITRVFGDRDIGLRAVTQHEYGGTEPSAVVPVVVLTHQTTEGQMRAALEVISRLEVVRARPVMIRLVQEHEEYAEPGVNPS